MKAIGYVAAIAFLGLVVAGSFYAPRLTAKDMTWSSPKSATVTKIVTNPATGHVSYGLAESSGANGSVTTVHGCGYIIGQTILYQDSSIGTRRIYQSDCQIIPNEY